jgi:DNA-binding CsgD family transcriptional regulator
MDVAARASWLGQVPALVLPAGAQPDSSTFRAALEKFHRGLLVIDANLHVLFANAGARRILERGDALQSEAGTLGFRSRDALLRVRGFAALLAAGLADPSGGPRGSVGLALRLDRLPQASPYRAWVSGLSEPIDGFPADPPPAAVPASPATSPVMLMMIFDPDVSRVVRPGVLVELYGLTPTEAELAARLFAGLALDEAAAAMHIKLSTARSHLKGIFRKCDVETQAQLLQLIALGPR